MLGVTAPINVAGTRMNPDEIEQRIIRAYIQLACTPEAHGSRTVTLVRFGVIEARLTEIPDEEKLPGIPWFWLELYSHAKKAVVNSCGFTEFDEGELARGVALIASAKGRAQDLH